MDKFTATNVFNKRMTADQMRQVNAINNRLDVIESRIKARKVADAKRKVVSGRMAVIAAATAKLCKQKGIRLDALTRDTRTADAKALDGARHHLTGKAPRTADESNHLAALAAKYGADNQRAQAINEANAQRGIKGLLAKALAALS